MRKTLIATLLVATGLTVSAALRAATLQDWDAQSQAVYEVVNQQRLVQGLGTLLANSELQIAAEAHSQDMADNDFFSHTGSNGSTPSQRVTAAGYAWTTTGENIAAGYGFSFLNDAVSAAREVMFGTSDLNLLSSFSTDNGGGAFAGWDAVGTGWSNALWDAWDDFRSASGGSGGWMGSSGHRANILNAAFDDIGIGYVFGAGTTYGTYWTQEFAAGDSVPAAAVPLPAAAWLLGGALTLFGATARRRRRCE